ncbi:MAG: hypothetical protein IT376_07390 [Polyangiaceae bacterium]|nr:hypothetical protein [Polyangiaceae bacterium]
MGTFQLTYYWVAYEGEYSGAATAPLYDESCGVLASVPSSFRSAISLEGTGRLLDGRLLNVSGSCACPYSPCFLVADTAHPWGYGVQNRALVPFRSIAVDKDVIPYGTRVYAQELDGVTMPGEAPWGAFVHDGCLQADDTGGAIVGAHIDFFAALEEHYQTLDTQLGLSNVTLSAGGSRCP